MTSTPQVPLGTPASTPAAQRPAHRDGNVLRWLTAYTASMIGDAVYFVALSWAATRTGTPGQAGLVLALGAVPRAVLMLAGGVVADRFGPRRVVLASDTVRCLVMLTVAALLILTGPGLWLLALAALAFGAMDALFLPAVGALPPRLTDPGQLARVQGMRGVAARIGLVTAGPLGGLAVALGGSATAFATAGALFALSLALLVTVRIRPLPTESDAGAEAGVGAGEPTATSRHDPLHTQLMGGLRYIGRHPVLRPLVLVMAIGELGFAGPANIGTALLAQERGWGATGLGWIIAGFGIGAGAASALLAVRGRIPNPGIVQSVTLLIGAAALVAIAYAPSVRLAVVAACCTGLSVGLAGAVCAALQQTVTAPTHLGRVTSVCTLVTMGLAPLCHPVVGAAIGVWGAGPVFLAGATVSALGAALGLCTPALRAARLPH